MDILVAVLSFPGFLEDLLRVKIFTNGVLTMSIVLSTNTIMNIMVVEDLVVDTITEEAEDLMVDMADITN